MRKIAKSSSLLKKTSLTILLLNLYSSFENYEITVEVHLNRRLLMRPEFCSYGGSSRGPLASREGSGVVIGVKE